MSITTRLAKLEQHAAERSPLAEATVEELERALEILDIPPEKQTPEDKQWYDLFLVRFPIKWDPRVAELSEEELERAIAKLDLQLAAPLI